MIVRIANKIKRLFEKKAIVLMYHRIAELDTDPWQLAVSPANFEQHLDILSRSHHVFPVKELVSELNKGSVPSGGISLTFDDGYKDNFFDAKPLLEKYNSPATFFIASQYVDGQRQFWWDELESIILGSTLLPATLAIEIDKVFFDYQLENEGLLTPADRKLHSSWVWPDAPPTQRCAIYLALWERLKTMPYEQLMLHLDEIKNWAGYIYAGAGNDIAMTSLQIEKMVNSPLFEIGVHTITHPALASHPPHIQQKEIAGCKQFLEQRFDCPITTMAYPYGNYNEHTLRIARELPLKASFTTQENYVTKNTNPYQIGRFQVKNWNGKEFEQQLYRWTKRF